jgi:hypothetical protein
VSDDKKATGAPPAITPRTPTPRPDAPPRPEGFGLPEVDTSSFDKKPAFSAVTRPAPGPSSPVGSSPVAGSDEDARTEDGEPGALKGAGMKLRTWGGSAVAAVQRAVASDEDEDDPRTERTAGGSGTSVAAGSAAGATKLARTDSVRVDEDVEPAGPRKVRLAIARVDPWSVMKLAFLLSVAAGIMIVVAAWVFWYAMNDLGVFTSIDEMIKEIVGPESELNLLQFVERDRIIALATIVAVIDVVLMTALATIGAFLFNVTAALVGGINLTLTDD